MNHKSNRCFYGVLVVFLPVASLTGFAESHEIRSILQGIHMTRKTTRRSFIGKSAALTAGVGYWAGTTKQLKAQESALEGLDNVYSDFELSEDQAEGERPGMGLSTDDRCR